METRTILIYSYEELSEKAKNVAMKNLIDHLEATYTFCLQEEEWDDSLPDTRIFQGMAKAIKKADDMQTPWFTDEYIIEEIGEELIALMAKEKWLFTEDGTFFPEKEEGEPNEHQLEGQPG